MAPVSSLKVVTNTTVEPRVMSVISNLVHGHTAAIGADRDLAAEGADRDRAAIGADGDAGAVDRPRDVVGPQARAVIAQRRKRASAFRIRPVVLPEWQRVAAEQIERNGIRPAAQIVAAPRVTRVRPVK